MPCFRAMFLHLFGLCIISSTVLSVVASPIFHDEALLVPRADNHPGSEASSTVSHPGRWEHDEDGDKYWNGDSAEDSPETLEQSGKPDIEVKDLAMRIYHETLEQSGKPDIEVKDLAIRIYQTLKGQNIPESGKKYWLCVGSRCLRANKDPNAPSDLLSDVTIRDPTLQESKDFGKISFKDIEHKRRVLVNFGQGERHYFTGNSNPSNWVYLAALLRELRRESAGGQLANQGEIEQYMKEKAKKNLFG